jgi:phage tail sheath protein FI
MAIQPSTPGVYIEEFAPGAPIQGVSTSTTAFIGIAADGELKTPTKLTSWDAFKAMYGAQPVPGFYLWHAVHGYFQNGGQVCYIVRASNGDYGRLTVKTAVGTKDLFTIRARQPGAIAISAGVAPQHLLAAASTSIYQLPAAAALTAKAAAGDNQVVLAAAHAALLRPGDVLTIAPDPGNLPEHLAVARVASDGVKGTVLLGAPLDFGYSAGNAVRLDDLPAGATTVRLTSTVPVPPGALVPGTMLTFTQGASANTQVVEGVQVEFLGALVTYRVTLRSGIAFPVNTTKVTTVQSEEFAITIQQGAGATVYDKLGLDSAHPNFYLGKVNGDVNRIVSLIPAEPPPAIPMPGNLPAPTVLGAITAGKPEDLSTLTDLEFIEALDVLQSVPDVNLIACPDRTTAGLQQAIVAQCQLLADRFAVLDSAPGIPPFNAPGALQQRAGLTSPRGYAAFYYPWLRVPALGAGDPILVPPSGHVCGIFARVDHTRGVFKAPANEYVNGAVGVERDLSDIDHGQLNLAGIDVIRVFQAGAQPMLFGARTTASDRNWQYVNIRRLFLYLEESIQQGIQWAVFEPNNLSLWQKLKRSISDFLDSEWRAGALFGAKAQDAYYVRIDEALNPFSEQQLGRLHIEIGVRPTYPAEFIVVRIGIWPGGAAVTEA